MGKPRATVEPLATPRRIAFAGDWHGNSRWAHRAVDYAHDKDADVIVHLGDFGYDFLPTFLSTLDRARMPILFIDGNHEDHPYLNSYPIGSDGLRQLTDRVWHLPRGFRWTWDGVRFLACGGAYSVDRKWRIPQHSWWIEEEITDEDVRRCIDGGPADVLIAHDCPSGVMIPGIDDRTTPAPFPQFALDEAAIHRRQLRRVVDAVRPVEIWHGHYHVHYAKQVTFPFGDVSMNGLDCDDRPIATNIEVVDLDDIKANVARTASNRKFVAAE